MTCFPLHNIEYAGRAYARSGQSDLLPNVDFCVRTYRHYARQRKRLFFSVRGVERIIMGARL